MKVCAKNVCGSAVSLGSCLITPTLLVHSHFHNVPATWDEDEDGNEEEEEEEEDGNEEEEEEEVIFVFTWRVDKALMLLGAFGLMYYNALSIIPLYSNA